MKLFRVELNKALLREIGKRSSNLYDGSEYPPGLSYYDRKQYNQHVLPMPVHGSPAEDELEAVVESLLLRNREDGYAGKHQRTRSTSGRFAPATPDQSQQLSNLFNAEAPEDLKTKDQALRQSLSLGHELGNTNDNGEEEEEQEEDDEQAGQQPIGGRSGVLKPAQDAENLLEQPNQPVASSSAASSSSSDRNGGTELGPRYVYGMYKNRYAN
uniref:Uncharacterized protein n=1 Tax=Anopheles epiroticus TaxID=199890 RepID=A0A182PIC8_9DIPT